MLWRTVVLSLLVMGLTVWPAAALGQPSGTTPMFQEPMPAEEPTPGPPRGSFRPVTRSAAGYEVTINGGRWPYMPPMTPTAFPVPATSSLALDVSIVNRGAAPLPYSAANFLVRNGEWVLIPESAGVLQPWLGDGQLAGATSTASGSSTVRGWMTFSLGTEGYYDGFVLEFTPSGASRGSATATLSLPLDIVR